MTLLHIYLILSTLMLLFIACIWSSKSLLNVALKIAFFVAAFLGAVLVAQEMFI